MRKRGSAFWQGPGLLLGCFGLIMAGVILALLAAVGPPVVDGIVLIVVGVGVIWARAGFGEYAYAKAQRSYIWPRDPVKMKPNAELEAGLMTGVAVLVGTALIIGGLVVMAGAD